MPYLTLAEVMRRRFGCRVQKLSVDAGFTCPNRDGTLGHTGCIFCAGEAFVPSYCRTVGSVTRQIDEGIRFHQWRYRKATKYLAYFQSYSNTYAPLEVLKARYGEALAHPQVSGIVVGTRPDCIDEEKLDYLASLSKEHYVAVEYGIESCYDETLVRIRRGHDFACTEHAIRATAARGLHVGGHLIFGLPGESRSQMLAEADILSALPLDSLKLHQLQILRGTELERQWREDPTLVPPPFTLEEYIDLVCEFLLRLRPTIAIERLAGEVPPRYQATPDRSWRRPSKESTRTPGGALLRNEDIPRLVAARLQASSAAIGSGSSSPKE